MMVCDDRGSYIIRLVIASEMEHFRFKSSVDLSGILLDSKDWVWCLGLFNALSSAGVTCYRLPRTHHLSRSCPAGYVQVTVSVILPVTSLRFCLRLRFAAAYTKVTPVLCYMDGSGELNLGPKVLSEWNELVSVVQGFPFRSQATVDATSPPPLRACVVTMLDHKLSLLLQGLPPV